MRSTITMDKEITRHNIELIIAKTTKAISLTLTIFAIESCFSTLIKGERGLCKRVSG